MKPLIVIEELSKLVLCFLATLWLGYPGWLFFALLLAPDISMIGYLVNTTVGAFLYNVVHHQGVAILVGLVGYYMDIPHLVFAGFLLLGHSAMDRMFGYGLKYTDDFRHTHLGWIGKEVISEKSLF